MVETRENTTSKEMKNNLTASLHNELRTMESKFQSQLGPIQDFINELLRHFRGKKYLEASYEHLGEETSHAKKDPPSFGFFTSPHHALGDTCRGPQGPRLDMQKFDGTDPMGWVSKWSISFSCIISL